MPCCQAVERVHTPCLSALTGWAEWCQCQCTVRTRKAVCWCYEIHCLRNLLEAQFWNIVRTMNSIVFCVL